MAEYYEKQFPFCGGSILPNVVDVNHYTFTTEGHRYGERVEPVHLFNYIVSGRVKHWVNGNCYFLLPGTMVWHFGDDIINGVILEPPWIFYSFKFIAPGLAPPSFEERCCQVGDSLIPKLDDLLSEWRGDSRPPEMREFAVNGRMLMLLADMLPIYGRVSQPIGSSSIWWDLESKIRHDLGVTYSFADLEKMSGKSRPTIVRSCMDAMGTTPMKRLKQVRLSLAQGLIIRTSLSMTEIALRVGYERVHEFSRDYRRLFGVAPSDDRILHEADMRE